MAGEVCEIERFKCDYIILICFNVSLVPGRVFIAFVSRLKEKKGLGTHVTLNLSNTYRCSKM